MSKRKFALKSLFGITSKPTRPTNQDDGVPDYVSDTESEEHFDPNAVNRPPPLDSRTEIALREACTIIVQNLKPSGYDIEDTRMKSDILVEDLSDQDEPPVTALPQRKNKPANNPVPTTWYNEDSGRTSKVIQTVDGIGSADYRRKSGPTAEEIAAIHAKRKNDYQRVAKTLREDYPAPELEQNEAPIAPVASARTQSRDELSAFSRPSVPPVPVESDGSVSTMSTQAAISTNPGSSVATNGTSVTHTPASALTSQRTSEQTARDPPLPPGATAAAAGAWMRQEVEKRRQAATVSTPAPEEPREPEEQVLEAQAVPIVYSRAASLIADNGEPIRLTEAQSRSESRNAVLVGNNQANASPSNPPSRSNAHTPSTVPEYQSTDGRADANPMAEANGAEYATGGYQRADYASDSFDATLASIRERMAATSRSAQSALRGSPSPDSADATAGDASRAGLDERITRDASNKAFSTARHIRGPSWPVPPRMSSAFSSPDGESRSGTQQDSGVSVKDFWQPKDNPEVARIWAEKAAKARALRRDSDPTFDGFVSVVDQSADINGRRSQSISSSRQQVMDSNSRQAPSAPRHYNASNVDPHPELLDDLTSPSTSRTFSLASSEGRSPALPPVAEGTGSRSTSRNQQYSTYATQRTSHPVRDTRSPPTTGQTWPHAPEHIRQSPQPQFPQGYPPHRVFRRPEQDAAVVNQFHPVSSTNQPVQADAYTAANRPPMPQIPRPASVKSPARLSISSRAASTHNNVSNPSPKSSALKRWLGRRKSVSARNANANNAAAYGYAPAESYEVINGYGGMYGDEEYDDPLVCAAPVVAFGRGW